jgi:hypothetical protein
VPLLFAVTLFVSAFLLFLVQPLVGKMILPLLGGTPAVWNTCMVFFQAALLAGYAYTHSVSTYLPTRRQLILQSCLLVLPFLFLPFAIGAWQPPTESNPAFAVLGILAVMVGIPFFVVATSAPLLQKWFAATGHPSAKDPYFLYGASNLGSMLALLSFPTFFEPLLPVAELSWFWTFTYLGFLLLTLACAAVVWLSPPVVALAGAGSAPAPAAARPTSEAASSTAIRAGRKGARSRVVVPAPAAAPPRPQSPAVEVTPLRRLRWIGLAAVPSSLMLGVTTYITTDIAAVPFFWVIPLALYLLSFILVFMRWPVEWVGTAHRAGTPHRIVLALQPLSLMVLVLITLVEVHVPQGPSFVIHLTAFFLTALLCHGELARDRPTTRHLTEFYLCMSLGGVLGGLLNGLIAPMVFDRIVEYMLVLALSCLLRPPVSLAGLIDWDPERKQTSTLEDYLLDVGYGICLGVLTYALLRIAVARNLWGEGGSLGYSLRDFLLDMRMDQDRALAWGFWISALLVTGIPLVVCLVFSGRPLRFGLCALAFFLANGLYTLMNDESLYVHRNFFGVIRVRQDEVRTKVGGEWRVELQHTLIHGGIDHGRQYVEPPKRYEPVTYFHPDGPIGRVFTAFKARPDRPPYAVVGLGIGTLAAYGRQGQEVHFYEIDPAVLHLSLPPEGQKAYFFYLQDALKKGVKVDVRLGDGRLVLKKQAKDREYHIIVLDAFSSDAIPVHLLTLEALDLYLTKLADGGVLIFNITNRYVEMQQPLANLAGQRGLLCLHGSDRAHGPDRFAADWIVMIKPPSAQQKGAEAMRLFGPVPVGGGLSALPWHGLGQRGPLQVPAWLREFEFKRWDVLQPNNDRVWTDDYSNLLSVLSL